MTVAIDLGNTRAKVAFFRGKELVERVDEILPGEVVPLIAARRPASAIISSVNAPVQGLKEQLSAFCPCLVVDASLPVPINKQYQTPHSLGADRLAASVGGWSLFPGEVVLVIDSGTCITYDVVDAEASYCGGAISPGFYMRIKALHNFTARLPLLDHLPLNSPLLGQSTEGSILSGVINGTCAEIEAMISKFKADFGEIRTLICGGDAKFFETKINHPIFVIPELVLIGLNEILLYNAPDK